MIDVRAIAADIGVHLSDETVSQIQERAKKLGNCCDWRMWMKNRLGEIGLLRAKQRGRREVRMWVLLNVFPIHRDSVRLPDDDRIHFQSEVARSDIVTGFRVPRPIDRVACRVAPGAPPTLDELLGEFWKKA